MALTGDRTFVGFGFGPIQAGLFLLEADRSGAFGRLVVAEVAADVVAASRAGEGSCSVNVAHRDRIELARLGPVELADPAVDGDRRLLVAAIAEATELATAVPSVDRYVSASPGSIHRLLAAGLRTKAGRRGPDAVVYAAENHNHAAELLERAVLAEVPPAERAAVSAHVRFLNTVIGKMSRVVAEPAEVAAHGLAPAVAGGDRAFLVEAFNHILVSRTDVPRALTAFEQKDDLLPFEEAKLYGHNAAHALAGYLAALDGIRLVADLRDVPELLSFVRAAFVEESGAALVRRHAGVDALFTPRGYAAYADDLIERMTNPFLLDTVERVTRDPDRKLGWNDRLIGTIRIGRAARVAAPRFAVGAAAAALALDRRLLGAGRSCAEVLLPLWRGEPCDRSEQAALVELVDAGLDRIRKSRTTIRARADEIPTAAADARRRSVP